MERGASNEERAHEWHDHPIMSRSPIFVPRRSKVARWQNLIPSFPWIAPGRRAWGRNPRKGRYQILQRNVAEPYFFKPIGPNTVNLKIWLSPSGNNGQGAKLGNWVWLAAATLSFSCLISFLLMLLQDWFSKFMLLFRGYSSIYIETCEPIVTGQEMFEEDDS